MKVIRPILWSLRWPLALLIALALVQVALAVVPVPRSYTGPTERCFHSPVPRFCRWAQRRLGVQPNILPMPCVNKSQIHPFDVAMCGWQWEKRACDEGDASACELFDRNLPLPEAKWPRRKIAPPVPVDTEKPQPSPEPKKKTGAEGGSLPKPTLERQIAPPPPREPTPTKPTSWEGAWQRMTLLSLFPRRGSAVGVEGENQHAGSSSHSSHGGGGRRADR